MKVLLPIDGSAAANKAVEHVRSLSHDNPLDVIVVYVSYDPAQFSFQPWLRDWTEQEKLLTQKILDNAKQLLEPCCQSVKLVHGSGASVPFILDHAQTSEVDLIVLGAKGHSTIGRILLGSVSDSVASRAKCSVLVVRSNEDTHFPPKKLLLGFDKSIASREAAAELMEWNFSRDIAVNVLSAVQNPYIYATEGYVAEPIVVSPKQLAQVGEMAERMASQIAEHFPHTDSHAIVADHIGEAIVQAADDDKADLVVVGDTGHTFLGELLLGSTSKYVLRHAHCSVLISRHHWKSADQTREADDAVATT